MTTSTPPAWNFLDGHWRDECYVPETTSPADSSHETASFQQGENSADVKVDKCPVCWQELDHDESIFCDHCEARIGIESFAVVNGPGGVFVYHLRCYDELCGCEGELQAFRRNGLIPKRETAAVEETPLENPAEVADKMAVDGLPPWTLYKKEKQDVVVEDFRSAAEAAILDFDEGLEYRW